MAFYDLNKTERVSVAADIYKNVLKELITGKFKNIIIYFEDADTYIRKAAYLAMGKIYFSDKKLQYKIIKTLDLLYLHNNFKIRQTAINAAGE